MAKEKFITKLSRRCNYFGRGCYWFVMFFIIADAASGFKPFYQLIAFFAILWGFSLFASNVLGLFKYWNKSEWAEE